MSVPNDTSNLIGTCESGGSSQLNTKAHKKREHDEQQQDI
ncbi:2566_t:CDS:2 [Ambispora gerdemannii]|uniref:2566_t:CDS:1 n=1 Tax=Ambispora gerdemannii TaxID=144530 RepID=A0A9N8ZKJ3_9GLOM|nr:2566_t:CDS:2 [Ambispora gerdemannii]